MPETERLFAALAADLRDQISGLGWRGHPRMARLQRALVHLEHAADLALRESMLERLQDKYRKQP